MSFAREIKRLCKALAAPVVFMSLTAYFGWSAAHGDHGLKVYAERQVQLQAAQAELTRAQGELETWGRRVASLRNTRLDSDALDERARQTWNLADPNDIVVMYGPGKKLY